MSQLLVQCHFLEVLESVFHQGQSELYFQHELRSFKFRKEDLIYRYCNRNCLQHCDGVFLEGAGGSMETFQINHSQNIITIVFTVFLNIFNYVRKTLFTDDRPVTVFTVSELLHICSPEYHGAKFNKSTELAKVALYDSLLIQLYPCIRQSFTVHIMCLIKSL